MGSLKKCLDKFKLGDHEKAVINGMVTDLKDEGYQAHQAAVEAVKQFQEQISDEIADVNFQVDRQLEQEYTKTGASAFQKWFGGSKVVDQEGRPRIVYHGTNTPVDFQAFDTEPWPEDREDRTFVGRSAGADPSSFLGAHFAESPKVANQFAKGMYEREGETGIPRVYPVYLSVETPWEGTEEQLQAAMREMPSTHYTIEEYAEEIPDDVLESRYGVKDTNELWKKYDDDPQLRRDIWNDVYTWIGDRYDDVNVPGVREELAHDVAQAFRNELIAKGYDGIRYKNEIEGGIAWIAFHPWQVKSQFNLAPTKAPQLLASMKPRADEKWLKQMVDKTAEEIRKDSELNPKVADLVVALNKAKFSTHLSGDLYGNDLVYVDLTPDHEKALYSAQSKLPEGWVVTIPFIPIHQRDVLGKPIPVEYENVVKTVENFSPYVRLSKEGTEVSPDEITKIVEALKFGKAQRLKASLKIPHFKTTIEAFEFGKQANADQVRSMKEMRLRLQEELKSINMIEASDDDLNGIMQLAAQAQYLREAVEASEGVKAPDQGSFASFIPNLPDQNGRYSVKNIKAWADGFPKIVIHTTVSKMRAHPDYFAAKKEGDLAAGGRLAEDLVKVDRAKALKEKYPDAILVPMIEWEEGNKDGKVNVIPFAFAYRIGDLTGLPVSLEIASYAQGKRTGKDAMDRILFRPYFLGKVEPNRDYILVDDAVTQGGTLAEARHYIDNAGGNVVCCTTLTAQKDSTQLSPRGETLEKIRQKFTPEKALEAFRDYDLAGSLEALTEGEAAYLARFSSLESFTSQADERLRQAGGRVLLQETSSVGLISEENTTLEDPKELFSVKKKGKVTHLASDFLQPIGLEAVEKIRMQTTGNIAAASNVVRGYDDAASLFAPLRKSAQEQAYAAAVGSDGTVLAIHRYGKGGKASASVYAVEMVGPLLRVPGTKVVYWAHNHPSGVTAPSAEDFAITRRVYDILDQAGVESRSIVIAGSRYAIIDPFGYASPGTRSIRPTIRKLKIPVKERYLVVPLKGKGEKFSGPDDVGKWLAASEKTGKSGILLLNSKNQLAGWLPFDEDYLPGPVAFTEIVKAAEFTNALSGIMVWSGKLANERTRKFSQAMTAATRNDIVWHDAVVNGRSAEASERPEFNKDQWISTSEAIGDQAFQMLKDAAVEATNMQGKFALRRRDINRAIERGMMSENALAIVRNMEVLAEVDKALMVSGPGRPQGNAQTISRILKANPFLMNQVKDVQRRTGVPILDADDNLVMGPMEWRTIENIPGPTASKFYEIGAQRPELIGALRTLTQTYLDQMGETDREDFRKAIVNSVEAAYEGRVPTDRYEFGFTIKNLSTKKEYPVARPFKRAHKTYAALNINTQCPMFIVGARGCYLDGCYVIGNATTQSVNFFRSAVYTGEILQVRDSEIEMLKKTGGLRVNGMGDLTWAERHQIVDVIRHAKMRGLRLKFITKQDDTFKIIAWAIKNKIPGAEEALVQPSIDPYWVKVQGYDDLPGSAMVAMQIPKMIQKGKLQEAADFIKKHFGRDAKVINGELYRKYGFSWDQIKNLAKKYPRVRTLPRAVVSTPKEIAEYALRMPEVLQTWMHAVLRPGMYSDIEGRPLEEVALNFRFPISIQKVDGEWRILRGLKDNEGPGLAGEGTAYKTVEDYIKANYTPQQQEKIFSTLSGQLDKNESALCCAVGASDDACFDCQSSCNHGTYHTGAELRDIAARGAKELATGVRSIGKRDLLASVRRPVWYSAMERHLDANLPGSMDAKTALGTIKNWAKNGKYKPEEFEWSGIESWLSKKEGKVSKAEIADWLRENNLKLVEKIASMNIATLEAEFDDARRIAEEAEDELIRERDRLEAELAKVVPADTAEQLAVQMAVPMEGSDWEDQFLMDARQRRIESINELLPDFDLEPLLKAAIKESKALDEQEEARVKMKSGGTLFGPENYPGINVPGGRMYGEALLMLPKRSGVLTASSGQVSVKERYFLGAAPGGKVQMRDSKTGEVVREFATPQEAQQALSNLSRDYYKKGHFPDPNIIAHVRFDSRISLTYTPAQAEEIGERIAKEVKAKPESLGSGSTSWAVSRGIITQQEAEQYNHYRDFDSEPQRKAIRKILFMQEVQSDWHQDAFQKRKDEVLRVAKEKGIPVAEATKLVPKNFGYQDPFLTQLNFRDWLKSKGKELTPELDKQFKKRTGPEVEAFFADQEEALKNTLMVPDAPFKSSWPLLTLKRMMSYAVENDFDAIAWTKGKHQAARYDLSKRVSEVTVHKVNYGTIEGELRAFIQDLRERYGIMDLSDLYDKVQPDERERWDRLDKMKNVKPKEGEVRPPNIAYTVSAYKEEPLYVPGRTQKATHKVLVIERPGLLAEEVKELLGKELGGRAIDELQDEKWGMARYTGDDLKIGGHGMEGFYDVIMLAEANRFFNKEAWGNAKVEDGSIGIYLEDFDDFMPEEFDNQKEDDWFDEDGNLIVHMLPVTPEIKTKSAAGMPLFSVRRTHSPFYSKLEQVLADPKSGLPKKAPRATYLKMLEAWQKSGKFKADEFQYSGLKDYLSYFGGDTVTRDDILHFVRMNNAPITEILYSDAEWNPANYDIEQDADGQWSAKWREGTYKYKTERPVGGKADEPIKFKKVWLSKLVLEISLPSFDPTIPSSYSQRVQIVPKKEDPKVWLDRLKTAVATDTIQTADLESRPEFYVLTAGPARDAKGIIQSEGVREKHGPFSTVKAAKTWVQENLIEKLPVVRISHGNPQYATYKIAGAGGKNYRELLLRWSPQEFQIGIRDGIERELKSMIMEKGVTDPQEISYLRGAAFFQNTEGEREALARFFTKPEEIDKINRLISDWRDTFRKQPAFAGSHYKKMHDVICWVRFDERLDDDGKKVLFINEMQSDWHQEGERMGYGGEKLVPKIIPSTSNPGWFDIELYDEDETMLHRRTSYPTRELALLDTVEFMAEYKMGVARAPYQGTWPALALKRMVLWAAENGFDKVTWSTGAMQYQKWGSERFKWTKVSYDNRLTLGGYEVGMTVDPNSVVHLVKQGYPIIFGEFKWEALSDEEELLLKRLQEKKTVGEITPVEDKERRRLRDIQNKEVSTRKPEYTDDGLYQMTLEDVQAEEARVEAAAEFRQNYSGYGLIQRARDGEGEFIIGVLDPIDKEIMSGDIYYLQGDEQFQGEAFAAVDQAALEREMIRADKTPVTNFEHVRAVVAKIMDRKKQQYAPRLYEKYVDRVSKKLWERMQGEPTGLYLPRLEAMQKFYDEQVVNIAKDYFGRKEWGLAVPYKVYITVDTAPSEDIELDLDDLVFEEGPEEHPGLPVAPPQADIELEQQPFMEIEVPPAGAPGMRPIHEPVWGIDITNEMKLAGIERGMPMFSMKRLDPVNKIFLQAMNHAVPAQAVSTDEDSAVDPYEGLSEETKEAIQAAKGIPVPGILDWASKQGSEIWRSITRHRPFLDPTEHATVADLLRVHQDNPEISTRRAMQALQGIVGGLKPKQYEIFSLSLIMDDMVRDIESGLLAGKEKLPFGLTEQEAIAFRDRIAQTARDDPAVADALRRRQAFQASVKQALVEAELLPKAVLEDDRYWHHQVLQYHAVKEMGEQYKGVGLGGDDVRLKKKGWQRKRVGSVKEYNTSYVESEWEWVAQAFAQLETRSVMDRLREILDITPTLKTLAKQRNLDAFYAPVLAQMPPGTTIADIRGSDLDPLAPWGKKVAMATMALGRMASKGELRAAPEYDDIIDDLAEWFEGEKERKAIEEENYRFQMPSDLMEGGRLFKFFSHLMANNYPGAPWAGSVFKAVRERNKFIKTTLGDKFLTPARIIQEDPNFKGYTEWTPAPGKTWYRAWSIPDRLVAEVQRGEGVIDQEKIDKVRQILARGRDVTWIIPGDVAKTLDGFDKVHDDHFLSKASASVSAAWKQWTLISPFRVIKYNLNNMSGDLDIAFAYRPEIVLKYMPAAVRDLAKEKWGKAPLSQGLKDELELAYSLGVLGSGWSVQEVSDVAGQLAFSKQMEALMGEEPNWIQKGWRSMQGFTQYRENLLRFAAFRYFRENLRAGKTLYGASNRKEIDGIDDPDRKAAKLARELLGDYGNVTHAGQWVRKHLLPFYAWMEINAPRYVRMMRNVRHEGQGAGAQARVVTAAAVRAGLKTTMLGLKMGAFYALANLWNHVVWPDEEEELGEQQRRQLHLILGRREDGSIITMRIQGAFSDALSWFGSEDLPSDIMDLYKGKASISDIAKDSALATPIKILNALGPQYKAPAELVSGRSWYPDPFNPRPIRDRIEYVARTFSLGTVYDWLAGKPQRGGTVGGKLVEDLMSMALYSNDPGEMAYYDVAKMVREYRERMGKEEPEMLPKGKANSLYYYKQALRYGDLKAAEKYLSEYMSFPGAKETGITKGIERSHPLGSLAKKEWGAFLATLSPDEKERYKAAVRWYDVTYKGEKAKAVRQAYKRPVVEIPEDTEEAPPGNMTLRDAYKIMQK